MKKSIIIVDDEMPSREMLKTFVDWDKTEYEIVEEFVNGKDALDFIMNNRVDYVITDIQMPVMNGIDLIKEIKKANPGQALIVLSCHEKFSYAREAMKYGVKDYLIKDMLTQEDLLEALSQAGSNSATESTAQADVYENEFEQNSRISSLEELLINTSDQGEPIKIDVSKNESHVLMVVFFEMNKQYGSALFEHENELMCNIQKELTSKTSIKKEYVVWKPPAQIIILLEVDQIASQIKYIYDCQKMALKIRSIINTLCGCELTIGISKGFNGYKDITLRYEEAKNACHYRVFLGENKNIFYNTVFTQMTKFNPNRLEEGLNKIYTLLLTEDYSKVFEAIKAIYEEDVKGFMQYNYIKYVNARIISSIIQYIKDHPFSYETIFGKDFIPLNELDDSNSIEDIIEWFHIVIQNIEKAHNPKETILYSLRVIQAQGLIKAHFREGIGLHEIAERLGVHKVYLSRIFKEETGKNITQYLQELKIEEIKKLLETTNKSISDIAEELNYAHSQQLSVAFKRETNMSPKAYRNTHFQKKS
ncbi:MAG: hypothetical protein CVU84_13135 [Firmicutes bacterium HGW-Firmicutes-1]|jgi:two-component system response regulator YesN|nr:MAG: hypothetical protein CVU84_13135 [Firmicutes bacterium HGW-Firmicutes-1]